MIIRSATPADIPAMRAIEAHAATAAHWTAEAYERVFSGNNGLPRLALVLADGPQVVAFVIALCSGTEWEIENMAVAGNARRQGLGARLLGALLGRARSARVEGVVLEVRESNRAARALYEKWAFVESGRRRAYYSDPPEDAILYRLHLRPGQNGK